MDRWTGPLLCGLWLLACGSRSGSGPTGDAPGTREASLPRVADATEDPTPHDVPPSPAGEEADHLREVFPDAPPAALQDAAACDRGEAAGCYRIANLYEEGMGPPADMTRTHALYERACRAGYGHACATLSDLLRWASGPPADLDRSRELGRRACELRHLAACYRVGSDLLAGHTLPPDLPAAFELLAQGCRGGHPGACGRLERHRTELQAAGLDPSTTAPPPRDPPLPADACPEKHHLTTRAGGGPNLSGLAPLTGTALLDALPPELDGWSVENRAAWNARVAGTTSAGGHARYASDAVAIEIYVSDQAMNCTTEPGTGTALLASGQGRDLAVGERPARLRSNPNGLQLTLWVADRCEVSLQAPPLHPGTAPPGPRQRPGLARPRSRVLPALPRLLKPRPPHPGSPRLPP